VIDPPDPPKWAQEDADKMEEQRNPSRGLEDTRDVIEGVDYYGSLDIELPDDEAGVED
jgi:hypothetical protein